MLIIKFCFIQKRTPDLFLCDTNMSFNSYSQKVILKVLYTFDDLTTFLVRSQKPIEAKLIKLPNKPCPAENFSESIIGCIDLRKCFDLVSSSSPEWFEKGSDFSVYSKDVVEPGQPFVAYGLWSKLKDKKAPVIITGRFCKSVVNIFASQGNVDVLEVRLKFSELENGSTNGTTSGGHPKKRCGVSNNLKHSSLMSSNSNYPSEFKKRKTIRNNRAAAIRSTLDFDRAPLATRTQSLPFISEHSLAHRILISDMQNDQGKGAGEELDARGEPISSRFSSFQKLMKPNSPPTRAKRTKSFMRSVVKIGDVSTLGKPRKKRHQVVQKCVNCASTTNPPYKFHRNGIYEFGNSGLLCSSCHKLKQSDDIKGLRKRGSLGAKGLFDGPYNKFTTTTSGTSGKSKPGISHSASEFRTRPKVTKNVEPEVKSSPFLYSSPTATSPPNPHKSKFHRIKTEALDSSVKDSPDDLPGLSSYQTQLTDIDPVYHSVPKSRLKADIIMPSDSTSHIEIENDASTCNSTSDDDAPINATKLNTTLIPLEEDDDKENMPPNHGKLTQATPKAKQTITCPEGEVQLSPSLQRILDSLSNQSGGVSPTKKEASNEWVNSFIDFFDEAKNGEIAKSLQISGNGIDNISDSNIGDAEVQRVLGSSPNGVDSSPEGDNTKFEKTPKDSVDILPAVDANADTVKTQDEPDLDSPASIFSQLLEAAKQPSKSVLAEQGQVNGVVNSTLSSPPQTARVCGSNADSDSIVSCEIGETRKAVSLDEACNIRSEHQKAPDDGSHHDLVMPSSPYFVNQIDTSSRCDTDSSRIDKFSSMTNLPTVSSPVTDLSSTISSMK